MIPERFYFCEECGKKLKYKDQGIYIQRFDRKGGEPLLCRIWTTQCSDYVSGYSDHFYEYHDKFVFEESISKAEVRKGETIHQSKYQESTL